MKLKPAVATVALFAGAAAPLVMSGCGGRYGGRWVQIDSSVSKMSRADSLTAEHVEGEGLRVRAVAGDVTVTEGASDRVMVAYEVRAPTQEILDLTYLVAERDIDGTLVIRAEGPDPAPGNPIRWYASRIDITMPSAAWVDIDTGSGDVTVEGLGDGSRRSVADTGSGDVRFHAHNSAILADTGSGDVWIEGGVGDAEADTGSGNVTITNRRGKIVADTGSGNVTLVGVEDWFNVDTGSGDVVLKMSPAWSGRWHVDTGSGRTTIVEAPTWDENGPESLIDTGSGDVRVEVLKHD